MAQTKLTIRELAQLAGVSPTAVSFVLNDRPGVSDETRRRIQAIIDQTNFKADRNSKRLSMHKSFNICLAYLDTSNPFDDLFYFEVAKGMVDSSNEYGYNIVLNKNGAVVIRDARGRELERVTLQIGTALQIDNGATVASGACVGIWDPHSVPVLAEKSGVVGFHDFEEDVTVQTERDEQTGLQTLVIMESRESLHPQIIVSDPDTKSVLGYYHIPVGAHVMVHEGERVTPGRLLAKTPRKEGKTRDITGGLPRVAELFEARHPKDAADIAKIDGVVEFGENQRGRRCLIIRDEATMAYEEHRIPMGKHIVVFKGDRVRKGQQLTDGPIVPQEILDVCGPQELQRYLVSEVQQVYRLQGVEINDKHIEIIVRQMLRKVRITNPGDTEFLWGEQVSRQQFIEVNEQIAAEG